MFAVGSRDCEDLFGRRPSAIIDTRPDSDLQFLKLLSGKEAVLYDLAVRDLNQRDLVQKTRNAIMDLGDIEFRIQRMILSEIIERCFWLLHYKRKTARSLRGSRGTS